MLTARMVLPMAAPVSDLFLIGDNVGSLHESRRLRDEKNLNTSPSEMEALP